MGSFLKNKYKAYSKICVESFVKPLCYKFVFLHGNTNNA